MTLHGVLWLVGMGLILIGEQIIGAGMARWGVDVAGVLLVLGSLALRARDLGAKEPSRRQAAIRGLVLAAVASASLLPYALSTDDVTNLLGLDDDGMVRWQGVLSVLTPIVLIVGAVPMFFLDMTLAANPVVLPRDAARRATLSGLSVGLAVCLVFPVNYLASNLDDYEVDTSYFRTAKAGDATRAMVGQLTEPITVHLFFPSGNDVLEEVRPYFNELEQAAAPGMFTVEINDQALDIGLAEELKLRDNGWVVIRSGTPADPEQGELDKSSATVKFKMREELRRAQRKLKRFDSLFQKNLLKATRGTRLAYFVTGHGEASHREKDDDWRKLSKLRKELQAQSYKLEELSLAEGLAESVPDDADLLILAAPKDPLLPEEVASITAWLEQGGELLVLVDARSDDVDGVLGWLGLQRNPGPIADPKRTLRGATPYLVVADRYGSHATVSTLSKLGRPILFPMPVGLSESGQGHGKRTVLVRTYGSAFADANTNGRQDEGETAQVHNLAYAVEGGQDDSAWRAVVIGNAGFASDTAFTRGWLTGPLLVVDSVRWLAGEEDTIGETESEEDVKIDHSPDGQAWWFWGTIFAVPLLILGAATTRTFIRRRMA